MAAHGADAVGDPVLLAAQVRGLRDREELRDLQARYAWAVDDHDLDAVRSMFAPEAIFDRDGHLARGWAEIEAMLGESMRGFRRMVHTPHMAVVELADERTAVGRSSGHAELVTGRGVLVAAYRYRDEFVRLPEGWVFSRREVRFLYATPATEYVASLPGPATVRFPGEAPRASAVVPRAG